MEEHPGSEKAWTLGEIAAPGTDFAGDECQEIVGTCEKYGGKDCEYVGKFEVFLLFNRTCFLL